MQARVAGENLYGLNTAEGVVGKVKGVKELHVGNALACIDEVVAKVQHAHVQVLAQALHAWRLGGLMETVAVWRRKDAIKGSDLKVHELIVTSIKLL